MAKLKSLLLCMLCIFSVEISAQESLKYRWAFKSISNQEGTPLLKVDSSDYFHLKEDGSFVYELKAKNNLIASGTWQQKEDTLIFKYSLPTDTVRHYFIKTLNDTLLLINEGSIDFSFQRKSAAQVNHLPINYDFNKTDISLSSLARGILGLSVLVFLTFLLSSKRKKNKLGTGSQRPYHSNTFCPGHFKGAFYPHNI